MLPNSASDVSRPWVLIESWNVASDGAGGAPSTPAATWTFCSRIARTTSLAVSCRDASRSGSSQTRMLYSPAPKTCDGADAGQPRELVLDLQVRVVRQVEHVVALVRRDEVHDHDEVGRRLLGGDADALHVLRQARQRLGDAVLHLHLRVVEIGAEREGDGQRQRAVGRRLREHVEHALDAVHLLLERRGDRLGDHLRIGAGNAARTTTVGGTTPGYSLIGSLQQRQRAGDDDQQREDDREDRPGDEEGRELHCAPPIGTTVAFDLRAGTHPLQAVDDDELAGRQAVAHDAQAVDDRTERDGPRLDRLVAADDEHEAPVEIGADGAILDEHAVVGRPCRAGGAGRTGRASGGDRGCGRPRGR